MSIVYLKYLGETAKTYCGMELIQNQVYELQDSEKRRWVNDSELLTDIINGLVLIGANLSFWYTDPLEGELFLRQLFDDDTYIINGSNLEEYSPSVVTDSTTGKKSLSLFMNILTVMRELYNDPTNPVYSENFQQFIGTGGRELEHLSRTASLESIHTKHGWHRNECRSWGYQKPYNLLIYYGYPNSFNSGDNQWYNEKVSQDMAKYNLIVLGDGVQNPAHPDYANTQIIIPRIKELNPAILIFGYVSINQTYSNFQAKVDQWDTLQIHGIFCDEAGYDYGTVETNSREAFNQKVDYIHGKTYSKLSFVNSWNIDHIIGIENDSSYPNTTWNPSVLASTLTENDWYLLESFPINTLSYSSGYESKTDWMYRGAKAQNHRYTYGLNLAAVGIIDNSTSGGQLLFDFHYISSCMFALEAVGTSDTYYGANSVTVTFWTRPDISEMGRVWALSTTIKTDTLDNDVYLRFVDFGKFKLDFSIGAQTYLISKY